MIIITLS